MVSLRADTGDVTSSPSVVRSALAMLGGLALLVSLGLDWHSLLLDELNNSKVERGWDVQPLGLLVAAAGLVSLAAGVPRIARSLPVGRVLGCTAGIALAARLWMFVADALMTSQEDYATTVGHGYAVLLAGALMLTVAAGLEAAQHGKRSLDWRRAQAPHRAGHR